MANYQELSFPSYTGTGDIQGRLYLPDDLAASTGLLLQIVHGMAEHMERYDPFCRFLAENGVSVCINDIAGHGQSVTSNDQLGFFGASGGPENVLLDIDKLAEITLAKLSALSKGKMTWRRAIFGHSMGSFISRAYCTRNSAADLVGAIFSGTAGSNPALGVGLLLAKTTVALRGPMHRSKLLDNMMHMGYAKRIDTPRTEFDWLSHDQAIVDEYIADPWCGYIFTASGFRDLFIWLKTVSSPAWASAVPKGLPILMIAGGEDPVGQYGAGPSEVCQKLLDSGHAVELKIYPEDRHEVLNEINRKDVYQDVMNWLKKLPTGH